MSDWLIRMAARIVYPFWSATRNDEVRPQGGDLADDLGWVEYLLVGCLVVLAITTALLVTGQAIAGLFTSIAETLGGEAVR